MIINRQLITIYYLIPFLIPKKSLLFPPVRYFKTSITSAMKIKIANMVWPPVVIILFNWVFGRTSRASLQILAMRDDICALLLQK